MAIEQEDAAARTVRRRYDRVARTYDLEQCFIERLGMGRWRRDLWQRVPRRGRILEIGTGTGANMRYYPPEASMCAIDISEKMLGRAATRARKLGVSVELAQMDAQRLEFADTSFDAAVATCVFCSVPDPVAGLREAARVLKPGAPLFLLEHVRSANAVIGRVMDAINPIAVRMSGANINRNTVENVRRAGFDIVALDTRAFGIVKLIEARS